MYNLSEKEPEGYYLWHIGINVSDYSKTIKNGTNLIGLFLYIDQCDSKQLKLYKAESGDSSHWILKKEVPMPETLLGIIKFPYKSCYNPMNGKILLSFRDVQDRNRLVEL